MVKLKGFLLGVAIAACAAGEAADAPGQVRAIVGLGGMTFGESWRGVDGLLPAAWRGAEASSERVFYAADARERHTLGGVQLDWPGLLYRFVDDRLYAVEGEFSGSEHAFAQLQTYLSARHGAPRVSRSWEAAPEDSYVHQARLRSLAWYSADTRRVIWLMRDDHHGYLVALDRGWAGPAPDEAPIAATAGAAAAAP